jgi:hypothetical protein
MKKLFIISSSLLLLISCKAYLDNSNSIHNDNMDFNFLNDYNEFIYKSAINASADQETFLNTHFSIHLPKRIVNWTFANNNFYFEFEDKQIISIYSPYKGQFKSSNWILRETNIDEIKKILENYWNKQHYKEEKLGSHNVNRISKLYSDGYIKILLYNIKKEHFDSYLSILTNFKYLN